LYIDITDTQKIIIYDNPPEIIIQWNNQMIYDDIIINADPQFVMIGNEIYLPIARCTICCKQGIIKSNNPHNIYICSSNNGKRLLQRDQRNWYTMENPSSINAVYKISENNMIPCIDGYYYCYWVNNSNILITVRADKYINSPYYIYNIETRNETFGFVSGKSESFDANNYLIIQKNCDVQIRDIKTMELLRTFHFPHQIIFYHKQLDLAIIQGLAYYKINNKYELEKVTIGINYYQDMFTYPNQIMNVIIDNDLIDIPDDILYRELYQTLI